MQDQPFTGLIESETQLQAMVGEPGEIVKRKQLAALDVHCRAFIRLSPFAVVGTHDADGRCDVSPRGDAAGFVRVLDDKHLIIPDRPGNRRIDTMRNILQTGQIGIMFMIPGVVEELRVNGRAWITRDEALLAEMQVQGKAPLLGICVEVVECFIHCGKAVMRSHLWDQASQIDRGVLPSLGKMLHDQACAPNLSTEELDRMIQESYAKRLY
jgi:PPOX class probable FMN-dependent enzyme